MRYFGTLWSPFMFLSVILCSSTSCNYFNRALNCSFSGLDMKDLRLPLVNLMENSEVFPHPTQSFTRLQLENLHYMITLPTASFCFCHEESFLWIFPMKCNSCQIALLDRFPPPWVLIWPHLSAAINMFITWHPASVSNQENHSEACKGNQDGQSMCTGRNWQLDRLVTWPKGC